MSTENIPKDGWLVNLRIAGSVSTSTVEKAVSWNVGPHGYQRGKKEIHQTFEQGPPIICLQDVRIPKRRKNSVKRDLQRVFPHYWIYITTAQSPKKDRRDRTYVYSVLTALHSAFFHKVTQMHCNHSKQMERTHACTHTHARTHAHTHTCMHARTHARMHTYARMHVCRHARTWASPPHRQRVAKICSCKHARVLQELVVGSDNNVINASDKCVANQHTARVHVQDASSP